MKKATRKQKKFFTRTALKKNKLMLSRKPVRGGTCL